MCAIGDANAIARNLDVFFFFFFEMRMWLTASQYDRTNWTRALVRCHFRRWPRSLLDTSHTLRRVKAHRTSGPERARVDWPPVAQRARCTIDYTSGSSTWCLPSTRPVCARPYALSQGRWGWTRGAPAVHSAHVIGALSGPIRIRSLRDPSDGHPCIPLRQKSTSCGNISGLFFCANVDIIEKN